MLSPGVLENLPQDIRAEAILLCKVTGNTLRIRGEIEEHDYKSNLKPPHLSGYAGFFFFSIRV